MNNKGTFLLTDAVQSASTDSYHHLPPATTVDTAAHQQVGQDMTASPKKCHSCSVRIDSAKKGFEKKKNIGKVFSSLVQVFSCSHPKQNLLNVELEDSAMDLLLKNVTVNRINQKSGPSSRQPGTSAYELASFESDMNLCVWYWNFCVSVCMFVSLRPFTLAKVSGSSLG